MSKRLEMLEKLIASGKADSFARYALALEYRSADRIDDALRALGKLRESDAGYVPMSLQARAMLSAAGRRALARAGLQPGTHAARAKLDDHARSEMADLLGRIAAA